MRIGNSLLLLFVFFISNKSPVHAQSPRQQIPFFIPKTTSLSVTTNFHWNISKGFRDKWIEQMYINTAMHYSRNIDLVITNRTLYTEKNIQNKFTNIYLNYKKNLKPDARVPLLKYGTYLDIRIGMLQWIPTFTNVQLIFDNAKKFIYPDQIYGGSLISRTPLNRDRSLNLYLGANSGDIIYKKVAPQLLNLYLNYTKYFKYNLGFTTQFGIAEGSRHLVNYSYVSYRPKSEKIQLGFRIGKLPSIDASPYGAHIGFTRKFKYISLGGYYEKRIHQHTLAEIAGISWSIVGPPKLAKFFSTFNVFFDFNRNVLWMWIPILKVDIKN